MPYKITFEPLNHVAGVKSKTVEIETAAAAWKAVDGLMRSDESVVIIDPHGVEIEWHELKATADKEGR